MGPATGIKDNVWTVFMTNVPTPKLATVRGFRATLGLLPLVLALAVAADPVPAEPLRVTGTAGYLSEWELHGDVTEKTPGDGKEFSGSLIWKHVGLCSVNGPQEKTGKIHFQIFGSGASSRIDATLWFDGAQCRYSAALSELSTGVMDCARAEGVPLTLSLR
jgi:hypothetical protein